MNTLRLFAEFMMAGSFFFKQPWLCNHGNHRKPQCSGKRTINVLIEIFTLQCSQKISLIINYDRLEKRSSGPQEEWFIFWGSRISLVSRQITRVDQFLGNLLKHYWLFHTFLWTRTRETVKIILRCFIDASASGLDAISGQIAYHVLKWKPYQHRRD